MTKNLKALFITAVVAVMTLAMALPVMAGPDPFGP